MSLAGSGEPVRTGGVFTSSWPNRSWSVRMSHPLSRSCAAEECRNMWQGTRFAKASVSPSGKQSTHMTLVCASPTILSRGSVLSLQVDALNPGPSAPERRMVCRRVADILQCHSCPKRAEGIWIPAFVSGQMGLRTFSRPLLLQGDSRPFRQAPEGACRFNSGAAEKTCIFLVTPNQCRVLPDA